jgi:hypothetical protein
MAAKIGDFAQNVVVTGLILSAAAGTLGCKNLLKKTLKADAGATASSATPQDLADEQLQVKLDEYIKCLNSLSSPIHQSRQRYLSFIPKSGPTGKEANAGLYKLNPGTTANCSAGVARAQTEPPSDPKLESVGTEYAAAAADVDQLMSDADNYFELRLFKNDHWEKGKALHPKLMAGWSRFNKADRALHDTLDGITKPLAQRTLGRIEREDGKRFAYNRKKVLIAARELIESSDPSGEDDDIDASLYSASYTDFEKSLDDLSAYGSTHKAELTKASNPAFPMSESNYTQFVKEAGDFKTAAKNFWHCLQEAPAKSKTASGKIDVAKIGTCNGGPAWKTAEAVIKHYNDFIQTSNTRQFP